MHTEQSKNVIHEKDEIKCDNIIIKTGRKFMIICIEN